MNVLTDPVPLSSGLSDADRRKGERWKILKISLATLFVVTCWGFSPTGIRIGLLGYDPGHLALLRFLIASLFMALIASSMRIALPRLKDIPLLAVLGFFAVSLHHIALNFGQSGVSAGASSVLVQSTPLFTALLAHFVFKERVSPWRWGCVVLGMIGAAIVVTGDRGFGHLDTRGLLILLAAFSWSVYFSLQKRHSHRYDGLTMVCYTVWSGTAILLIYLPGLATEVLNAPMRVNVAVGVLGLFPSALAYLAWAYVLNHMDVSRASMSLYLTPPMAIAIASAMLGELPSPMVIVGAVVVLISVLALNLRRERVVIFPVSR
ncbi:DMT family transporter [Pseudomonas huanghezhanensis]|uniref:DMT family transporter n=1 Tax=Pseudomonas huanghezhanensis TaxID=3002903 RepID=UPI0022865D4A|nr:DMT family transporter [Pseudomonas sp. BSw22131]